MIDGRLLLALTNSSTSQSNIFRLGNGWQHPLGPTVDTFVNGMDDTKQCALLLMMNTRRLELKSAIVVIVDRRRRW
jgi:hypothetical protein